MGPIRAIAFDCDGVMFDTTAANKAYYSHLLRQFGGPPLTDEQFAFVHMHSVEQSVARLFGDPAMHEQVHAYRRTMDYIPFLKRMQMEPHLKPLIERLRPAYKTAVATNRTDTMDRVIRDHGLSGCFDLVVCARDVVHAKPHPDLLLKVLEHFDLAPDEMIYVGDSKLDELAARAAQVPLIAYRNPDLEAAFYIDSLADIDAILGV